MNRVLAIVELRARLLLRSARGTSATLGWVASGVVTLLGAGISLSMAAGFGVLVHHMATDGDDRQMMIAFLIPLHTFLFFGLVLPLITSTMQQTLDVSPLRIFPIGRARLFTIQLAAGFAGSEHLFYYPSLLAVFVFGAFRPGLPMLASGAVGLSILAFLGIWGNALNLFLGGVMRRRRSREIIGIVVLLGIVVASFLPALLDPESGSAIGEPLRRVERLLPFVVAVGMELPPSRAAAGLAALRAGDRGSFRTNLGVLLVWNLAGLVLGYRVFVRYHLGDPPAPRRRVARRRSGSAGAGARRLLSFERRPLDLLPLAVRAVAAKDLHYLFRSVVGKFVLLILPLFVIFVATVFADAVDRPVLGIPPERILLLGTLFYTTLFSNNLLHNAYAWEGEGAQLYFLSPVSLTRVIAGKNLAIWLYNLVLLAVALVTWSILSGPPRAMTLLVSVLTYAFGLLTLTTCGNVVSVYFPVRRNISAMNSSPSQLAVLLSLVAMFGAAAVVAVLLFVPALLGYEWLQALTVGVLLLLQVAVYRGVLELSARLLERRRESFLERLRSER